MEKCKHLWRVKMPGQQCWVYYRAADLAELEKEVRERNKEGDPQIMKVEYIAGDWDCAF